MNNQAKLEFVGREVGFSSLKRYVLRSQFVFEGLDLKNTRVLEIGCGRGAFCLWAALLGAEYVLGIEPEAEGSSEGSLACYRKLIQKLDLKNVEASNWVLQDLPVAGKKFDIILMYNVINHLDEKNVQILHRDENAKKQYVSLLVEMKKSLSPKGIVIVADCARRNFWNDMGIKFPLDPNPTIEWHKHQNPRVWRKIFEEAGFRLYDFRWSMLNPIGRLASNFLVQYFSASHFVLRFQNKS
jgi:SAM-dependent methyltransferase